MNEQTQSLTTDAVGLMLCVEKTTGFIFEVRPFDATRFLVRPATPAFYVDIRILTPDQFASLFDEFDGHREYVDMFTAGELTPFTLFGKPV